jgi:hypothetical protein
MKLAVVGSRDITDKEFIFNKLDEIHKITPITLIISGGALGVDSIAEEWARINISNEPLVFIPKWTEATPGVPMKKDKYGRLYNPIAGLNRNTLIVEACTHLLAIWDGKSGGTNDSIKKAKKLNKIVEIALYK